MKCHAGMGMGWTGAVCCGLALPRAQSWQFLHHADTSEDMPRQTTRACCPYMSMWRSCKEVELAAFRVALHVFWLASIRA